MMVKIAQYLACQPPPWMSRLSIAKWLSSREDTDSNSVMKLERQADKSRREKVRQGEKVDV